MKQQISNIKEWALNQEPINKKNNKLINSIIDEKDIFETYKNDVDNIDIKKWTLSSFKTLEKVILNDIQKLSSKQDYQIIDVNGTKKYIQDVDLTLKAENAFQNLKATIEATKKYFSNPELELIILNLVNQYIK